MGKLFVLSVIMGVISLDKADVYRSEINRLIDEQNLPVCPYDGKPCSNLEHGCGSFTFGSLGDDVVWRCPRLKQEL